MQGSWKKFEYLINGEGRRVEIKTGGGVEKIWKLTKWQGTIIQELRVCRETVMKCIL